MFKPANILEEKEQILSLMREQGEMSGLWKELMGFIPLLVAIITTLLAFLFGKATEKRKDFI